NNFTMAQNTTIKIDVDAKYNPTTHKDLRIYLIGDQRNSSYFQQNWLTADNTSLIRSIPDGTPVDYTDANGSYYEIIIQSDEFGLFTYKIYS
ncbi:unnamed protein product, partial [marine sediment metagenome]